MPKLDSRILAPVLLCGGLALSACAAPNHKATHRRALTEQATAEYHNDIKPIDEVRAIPVYTSIEPGFSFDERAGKMLAEPGSGNEVLMRVELVFPSMENPAWAFWFIKYRPEQSWRKGLCYWQVPLWWVTLGIWKIVPLSYPCDHAFWHTGALREVGGKEKRMELLELGLKSEAARLGGNAIMAGFISDQAANGWVVRMAE